ncbi:MAG: 3-deoxy-7-phosphoheptulonate synthase [Calditrichaeota bacterium]|nr:3-deoxy-7-phosphoheptulonate synthase [Calditrichota bacterium]MCB9090569.1 3-deoxy-7-phosphoheptulonate synthase [Calditrichia bacterium]
MSHSATAHLPGWAANTLFSRQHQPADTVVALGDIRIGGGRPVIIAGPCSVESEAQILETAHLLRTHGAQMLRGGAFKPRTSPYSFQGLGQKGLELLAMARSASGLPVVTEVMDTADVGLVAEYADVLQIGSRNMQNFPLLKAVGRLRKPVLLKRGMAATLEEFLMSAEYILAEGNFQVILCERGIRTFSDYARNTLDLNIVPAVRRISHLPIIVDPSHGTGHRELVTPMSLAALACGAQGLIIETHPRPDTALSDAGQTISIEHFAQLMEQINHFVAWQQHYADITDPT